jgi:hypothetical protein
MDSCPQVMCQAPCSALDEQACADRDDCLGLYGGSCDLCLDYVFKGCIDDIDPQ